jgi:hypothetical protein
MKTKNMLTAGLIAVMLMLESSASVLAADESQLDPDTMAQKQEQVKQAILSGDFSTWYTLLTENGRTPPILEIITQDKFAKFSEAIKILDELGLKGSGIGMGLGMGRGRMHQAENIENRAAVETTILNNDYDAWYALMTENGKTPKIVEIITKDNFAKFSEATKLFKDGNKEEAAKIFQELGLDKKFMVKKWMKRGMKQSAGE